MTTQFAPIWDDAAVAFTTIKANATDTASAAATTLLDLQVNSVSKFTVGKFGELVIAPTARTSGSDSLISLIAPADTTRAASVEATDINFNLARTVQFAAGAITNQRAIRIQAPTYSFASASTVTNASTLSISGAPVAGTNATLTNRWALSIENNGMKLAFPSTSTSPLGLSRPSSNQWMYLVNTTDTSNRPIGIVFGGYDDYFHMALQSVMTSGSGNTYGKLSFVQQGGSEWLKIATSVTAEQNGVSIAESLSFGVLASNISPDTSLVREAAGVLAFRRSTTSHIARIYNTYTDASNYERLAFQFGTFSSARHAQIAAESAGTGTANINLVLTPHGTGAFILGPPPDGTSAGGNARGANAIDLQTLRSAATQVASAANSIAVGVRSTSSSPAGIALGDTAAATGGGTGRSVAIGCQATSSAEYTIAIGDRVSSTGSGAICISSEGGTATGNAATAIGPAGVESTGGCAIAIGGTARASRTNEVAFGFRHTLFDLRPGAFLLSCKTTNDTFTALAGNNIFQSSIAWTTRTGTVIQGLVQVIGSKSDSSAIASYTRKVIFKNVAGAITLVQSETIGTDYEDNALTDLEITNVSPFFRVKGIAGEAWRWSMWFGPTLEMTFGT